MIELLRQRRSIRKYRAERLRSEQVEILKEAVLRSPSSRRINPWEFVFVDDPEILVELSRCKPQGASFLREAALGIVVCADETKSDVWVEDCSIASILAQLTAQSLGLGSCWVQIRKRMRDERESAEVHVRKTLAIPDHVRVESILAVGHPAEHRPGAPLESLDFTKIRYNRYG